MVVAGTGRHNCGATSKETVTRPRDTSTPVFPRCAAMPVVRAAGADHVRPSSLLRAMHRSPRARPPPGSTPPSDTPRGLFPNSLISTDTKTGEGSSPGNQIDEARLARISSQPSQWPQPSFQCTAETLTVHAHQGVDVCLFWYMRHCKGRGSVGSPDGGQVRAEPCGFQLLFQAVRYVSTRISRNRPALAAARQQAGRPR